MNSQEDDRANDQASTEQSRYEILSQVEDLLELPLIGLSFIWLILLVIELIWGLNPFFEALGILIWSIFALDFFLKFALAIDKREYLKRNVFLLMSLIVPAFRTLRIVRVLRVAHLSRGLRLVRVLSSLNRGMKALSSSMGRRGLGRLFFLTLIVVMVGSAAMFAFERNAVAQGGLNHYGQALWWTSMLMLTIGSDYWPKTAEGQILCLLLATYAFAVLGYFTAALATFFIGEEAKSHETDLASSHEIKFLHQEVVRLRKELSELTDHIEQILNTRR